MRMRAARALAFILDLVFPGRCLLCGEPLSGRRCRVCGMPLLSERDTCTRCRGTEFAFERQVSVFTYAGKIKELIGMYKFSGRIRLCSLFATYFSAVLDAQGMRAAELVPVPPRPSRPGPDHVERIAHCLAREHGFVVTRALERTTGISQKSLSFEERRENLSNGIRIAKNGKAPRRAVLLDDVFTTGATMDACARALRKAGSESVCGVSLAIDM
jgi:ComF family protein